MKTTKTKTAAPKKQKLSTKAIANIAEKASKPNILGELLLGMQKPVEIDPKDSEDYVFTKMAELLKKNVYTKYMEIWYDKEKDFLKSINSPCQCIYMANKSKDFKVDYAPIYDQWLSVYIQSLNNEDLSELIRILPMYRKMTKTNK